MPTDIPPITYGTFYHIYNRGNNHENIFFQERNYCLLRNHFHATIFIKNREDLTGLYVKSKEPSQYFSNFFNAYARGVNTATQRTGALFERPFKRIPVDSNAYLMRLIVYIHQNPQKHNFENDFRNGNYSSYHELTANVPTRLQRDRTIQLFGNQKDFIRIHQEIQPLDGLDDED